MRRLLIQPKKYLDVTPAEAQEVVWFVPGNTIEYLVKSNTKWVIE